MELPRRASGDVYLPDGAFTRAMADLRAHPASRELRVAAVYAFDFRTRMLPYWYADTRMAPCSVRTLADALFASGFEHTRVVLQQWTPYFRPCKAVLHGRPIDLLLVSAMQVHAEPSYDLIRDACRIPEERRPLILAGGPKAIYEPMDYFELGPKPGVGADCVVTGEVYVLLDLLRKVLEFHRPEETLRAAFDRARKDGALAEIAGLVYLDKPVKAKSARLNGLSAASTHGPIAAGPNGHANGAANGRVNGPRNGHLTLADPPIAVHSGIQRLLRDLDEMPMPDAGYRLLEPPHRGQTLRAQPLPPEKVRHKSPVASIISTQGCKFNCSYCPIPAVNQRTWRHKSPKRMAAEIKHIFETFGIEKFFGTDDNFFNSRETVIELMTELSHTTVGGKKLGSQIRFYTEATEFDVFRNQDILALCRKGGLRGIWFGIEDLTAKLINKGQAVGKTEQLFKRLHEVGIMPMAMMIHSDNQPLHTPKGDYKGLLNQARYLFEVGAVSYQCTYLGPAVGTRDFETALEAGTMFRTVGGREIPQAHMDGNHVVATKHSRPWTRQINILRAYSTFYNPWNFMRSAFELRKGSSISGKRFAFQILGHIGLLMTIPKLALWAWKMRLNAIEKWHEKPQARFELVGAVDRAPVTWAIEFQPVPAAHGRRHDDDHADPNGEDRFIPLRAPALAAVGDRPLPILPTA